MPQKEMVTRNMICSQVLPSNITNRQVIDALSEIPRDLFVPENFKTVAYVDEEIPLGDNRYMLAPVLFAQMLEVLDIQPDDVVLDIACAQGYSTAVFSLFAKKVVAVESSAGLLSKANKALHTLGIENALIITSEVTLGHAEGAPYDKIFINGSVAHVPETLLEQLNEGGSMVVVRKLVSSPLSEMVKITRSGDRFDYQHIRYTSLAQLNDFD